MTTTITLGEENYSRMSLLLFGIAPRAVRVKFDKEFAPSRLYAEIKKACSKLTDLKIKRIINQSQWNLLFPKNGVPDSNMFDVTLMITLLTHLTGINSNDPTTSADLKTIRQYRNQISHKNNIEINNTIFSTSWTDIIEAVGRLGGKNMLDECKELRTKILESSIVPWNIRVQINQTMEAWKTNNSTFVETRAAILVLACIKKHSCVTITASSGVGKTATLQHVALKMDDEGYDVLLITDVNDIIRYYNPKQKTLFVIDDFCGTYSINKLDLNKLESVKIRIEELVKNKLTKIIVACRLQVFQDAEFKSLYGKCVCNMHSKELCLSKTEKQSIAELYLDTKAIENIKHCDLYDCFPFPLLCTLYNVNPEFNITDFFNNPYSVYKKEIDKLDENRNNGKYCALALCVMFNNGLKEEWLTDVEIDHVIRTRIENTYDACRLNRGTSRHFVRDELNALKHTFVKKEKGVFKTIHDKLFDFLCFYFGNKMIKFCIQNGCNGVINQRFLLEKNDGMNQYITIVPLDCYETYMKRIVDDWFKGEIKDVFSNINMNIPEFRERLLCHLKTLVTSLQIKLALTYDADEGDTVLLQCCQYDAIPLIEWCIKHNVDVNKCNCDDVSPLIQAAQHGHTQVVDLLLKEKADINKCRNNRVSPKKDGLHDASMEALVTFLYKRKGNSSKYITKCDDNGASALYMACKNNHKNVVKLLLDKNANINKFSESGSPFYIACKNNHIDIVQILLDKKVNINEKCTNGGASPLYVACENNCIETVKILLDNEAEIDKSGIFQTSPLYIACQNNHIKIVKMLLEKNADTRKCSFGGYSPLYIACQNNHIEIVKMLLVKKADVNMCLEDGSSPLFIACMNNHISIIHLLLENEADINRGGQNGASPLIVACCNNHIETVNILLDNNADINKTNNDGASPLYIACSHNHIEIIKVLLGRKADINKSDNYGKSPFDIASYNKHKEAVNILLENKAD